MTVKLNEPKEAQKTLEAFSWEAGRPNPRFRRMLKGKVLAAATQPKLIFNFLNAMGNLVNAKWSTLAIAGLAGLVLLGAGGTGAFLYWQNQNKDTNTPNLLTQTEALKHLYAMRNAVDQANLTSAEMASTNDGSAKGDDSEGLGPIDDYNNMFYHYLTTTNYGQKLDECPMYSAFTMGAAVSTVSGTESYTSDYYSYSSDGWYWSKGVERLGDYQEITRLSTDTYSLEYLGGDYAIKFIYPEVDPNLIADERSKATEGETEPGYGDEGVSADEPVTDDGSDVTDDADAEPTIEDMFGPDAVVEGPVEENGRYYYIVTYEMDGSVCDQQPIAISSSRGPEGVNGPSQSGIQKVITKSWVDAEDGMWGRQEFYADSVSEENLITRMESTTESRNAELSEVEDFFTFNENVEIREIQIPNYVYEETDEKEEIQSADDPVLLLSSAVKGELTLQDIYVTEYNYERYSFPNVYEDRAFFPAGEYGDALYESYNNEYSGGLYEISKTGSYYITAVCQEGGMEGCYNVVIDVYSEEPAMSNSESKDITVNIDGNAVAAKIYEMDSVEMSSSCVSSSVNSDQVCTDSSEEVTTWKSYIISFSRGGYTYQIGISGYLVSEAQARTFSQIETLDVSNDAIVDALVEEINAGKYFPVEGDGGDGQPAIVEDA